MNPVVVRNIRIGEGLPKVCVPIVGQTKDEILQMAEKTHEMPADLAEWRVDWFADVRNPEAVKVVLKELRDILGDMPLIFTFRTEAEGGEQAITEVEYVSLNKLAMDSGCVDLIDVEMFSMANVANEIITYAKQMGVKVIGSNHDFCKTPEKDEIIERLRRIQAMGVDMPKIAVMPQNKADVLTLLSATEEMASKYADRPIITMSMGEMGVLSRVAGEFTGSALTFGTVGKSSAPGQIPVNELKKMLELIHRQS